MDVPSLFRTGQHFGTTTRQRRIGRFMLTQTSYASAFSSPWHAHEPPAFCLVLRGTYVEQFRNHRVDCGPSTVVFRPPGVDHEDRVAPGGAGCFIVEPDLDWWTDLAPSRIRLDRPLGDRDGRVSSLLSQAFDEFRAPDSSSSLVLEGLLVAVAARLARGTPGCGALRCPEWLRRTQEHFDVCFREPVSLAALAADASVHPVYLAAAFRRTFGCSIGTYVRRRRIEAARVLLASSGIPLARLAADLGFSSQSHFTLMFRRLVGTTPDRYRRQHARG